uniref:Uncharacterized protein n=1 Tax=Oryza glumipatula TaxID=40148 RepID=A0A0E0A4S0_9ORYZ
MFVNLWQSVTTVAILPPAPSAVATHSDSNNIVTMHTQREECISKIQQQSLQDYRISTSRADKARKSRRLNSSAATAVNVLSIILQCGGQHQPCISCCSNSDVWQVINRRVAPTVRRSRSFQLPRGLMFALGTSSVKVLFLWELQLITNKRTSQPCQNHNG